MPWHTVQTQIRLLLEEQCDQGLHCMPFALGFLDKFLHGKTCLNFSVITAKTLWVFKHFGLLLHVMSSHYANTPI